MLRVKGYYISLQINKTVFDIWLNYHFFLKPIYRRWIKLTCVTRKNGIVAYEWNHYDFIPINMVSIWLLLWTHSCHDSFCPYFLSCFIIIRKKYCSFKCEIVTMIAIKQWLEDKLIGLFLRERENVRTFQTCPNKYKWYLWKYSTNGISLYYT